MPTFLVIGYPDTTTSAATAGARGTAPDHGIALLALAVLLGVCGGVVGSGDVVSLGCLVAALVGCSWFTMFMRDQPGPAPRSSRPPRGPGA